MGSASATSAEARGVIAHTLGKRRLLGSGVFMIGFKELVILVAFVGILAAVAIPAWKSFKNGGRIGGSTMDSSRGDERFHRVVVTDIDLPFWDIVQLMVKWAIAAIPALLILGVIFALLVGVFAGLMRNPY